MSNQAIPILTLSATASGTIAAHRFVTPAIAQAGAGVNAVGVSRIAAVSGDVIPVDVLGTTLAEAGAAIAAGALVQCDANGKAITKSAGVTLGRLAPGATAGADGDLVEVILIPN